MSQGWSKQCGTPGYYISVHSMNRQPSHSRKQGIGWDIDYQITLFIPKINRVTLLHKCQYHDAQPHNIHINKVV